MNSPVNFSYTTANSSSSTRDFVAPILSANNSAGTYGVSGFAVDMDANNQTRINTAWKAFDGSDSSVTNAAVSSGESIYIWNHIPLKVTSVNVYVADGFWNKLFYSDDGGGWYLCGEQHTGTVDSTTYVSRYIKSTELNPHKYWKVTCINDKGSGYVYIGEITLHATYTLGLDTYPACVGAKMLIRY